MSSVQNEITLKTITQLLGMNFYIPEYQRGYRWTTNNVTQLLDDIWEYRQSSNGYKFYCLQPVVVKKQLWQDINGNTIDGYELIDGQQRLTTIHRILTYLMFSMHTNLLDEGYEQGLYSIYYKTRLESKTFLESQVSDHSKPDIYYMSEAYKTIASWFESGEKGIARSVRDTMLNVLLPGIIRNKEGEIVAPEWSVKVIWYEIKDVSQKSEELFTRLNRGKIPLTSAELIKAKFVNADSFKGMHNDDRIKRRTQLIQIWDEIETHLNNPKFWAFISNEPFNKYSNKIEYLFDIMSGKKSNEKDALFTFINFFDHSESADSLWHKWIKVEEIYRSILFWFSDKDYYHKIGFLITTGTSIKTLVDLKKHKSKSDFVQELNALINATIDDDWDVLTYDVPTDHQKITNVLLLFNIELTRKNENNNEFFPFEMYKRITKSLEHIHAQNIIGINQNRREEWYKWLEAHIHILPDVAKESKKANELIDRIKAWMAKEKTNEQMKYEDFRQLSDEVLDQIPEEETDDKEYVHLIQNMALLGLTENISLSNSVFEVKRQKIIEMDREGAYIPIGTKRVFLKYYASESSQQYSIWTAKERENYLKEITNCVRTYKPETVAADED